jgi:hypothetical protein
MHWTWHDGKRGRGHLILLRCRILETMSG